MLENSTLALSRWGRLLTMALIVVSSVVILFPAARGTSFRFGLIGLFLISATLHFILDQRAGLLGKTMGEILTDVRAGRIKQSRVQLVAYILTGGALIILS